MMQELVNSLNQLCDDQPFTSHWYVKNLRTNEEAHRAGDVVLYGASTRKVPIMMGVMKQVHEGRLSLDQPFTIEEKYQKNMNGSFAHFKPGFQITLYDALIMSIILSDNTCNGKIVDMLGLDWLNEYSRDIGMANTTHRQAIPDPALWTNPDEYIGVSNTTTANDLGLCLDLIVKGSTDATTAGRLGSSPELCKLALEVMTWQKLGRLSLMLPTGTRVGSKTGTGPMHFHDVGVIYEGDSPLYILAAYTVDVPIDLPNGLPGKFVATTHLANLCRTCWDALAA